MASALPVRGDDMGNMRARPARRSPCPFRLVQAGLRHVGPHLTRRRVAVSPGEFCRLCLGAPVSTRELSAAAAEAFR